MTMLARRPTAQNDVTGIFVYFVLVGACFESWAGTPAVITIFVASLIPFGNIWVVTSMKPQQLSSRFPTIYQ